MSGKAGGSGKAILGVRSSQGFTLIEMLVVMAVVALLMTIALPRYFGSLDRSKDIALGENLRVMRLTLDRFRADKSRYPDSLEELVEHKYLRAVPIDPITESSRTWVLLPSPDAEEQGIADLRSGAQGMSSDGRPYESF